MSKRSTKPVGKGLQGLPALLVHGIDRPWLWVERGWQDVRAMPALSLFYGFIVTLISWSLTGILLFFNRMILLAPMRATWRAHRDSVADDGDVYLKKRYIVSRHLAAEKKGRLIWINADYNPRRA